MIRIIKEARPDHVLPIREEIFEDITTENVLEMIEILKIPIHSFNKSGDCQAGPTLAASS